MGETEIPPGEVYQAVEGGNGELGFYLISDGGRTPYRLHFRQALFYLLSGVFGDDEGGDAE